MLFRPFSLSYEHRLHHPWQYRRFFNRSEVCRFSDCIIFRTANDLGHFRLGITLKSKGSSVERNRIKRSIREEVRRLAPFLGSFDYNVVIQNKKMDRFYAERLKRSLSQDLPQSLQNGRFKAC